MLLIMYLLLFIFFLILEGAQMAQSRYLFAISCFQMDLLSEAETALCPASEPSVEVQNIIQNIFENDFLHFFNGLLEVLAFFVSNH